MMTKNMLRRAITLRFAASCLLACAPLHFASADTQADICKQQTDSKHPIGSIDSAAVLPACTAALSAAPQDKQLQYAYARALESAGKRDQAKQLYQWLAQDNWPGALESIARLAGPLTGDAAERELLAKKADALGALATRFANAIPKDHEDLNTVLAKTGANPQAVLSWVRANIRLLPYSGVLRDASGVLMDRAGNSLDRALFMAELLHRSGINARLARTQISPTGAAGLRARYLEQVASPEHPALPTSADMTKLAASDPNLDASLLEKELKSADAAAQQMSIQSAKLYAQTFPVVLQAAGLDSASEARFSEQVVNTLCDYFWVQIQSNDTWADLDPDTDVVGAKSPRATFLAAQVPKDLQPRVTVRLSIEVLSGGKLSETKLLEQDWAPAKIATQPITIIHALLPAPRDVASKDASQVQSAFLDDIRDASVIMPTLMVGTQSWKGRIYDFNGQVQDATPTNVAAMGGSAIVNKNAIASGIASVFADTSAPVPAPAPATGLASNLVTAEWLDIEIAMPGVPVEKHRRSIFDSLGAKARAGKSYEAVLPLSKQALVNRALALASGVDAYVFGAAPSLQWVDRSIAQGIATGMTLAAKEMRQQIAIRDSTDVPPMSRIEPALWGWAARRNDLDGKSPGSPIAPNVALLWDSLSVDDSGRVVHRPIFDIVSNSTIGRSKRADQVAQGVYDTVVENLLAEGKSSANAAALLASDLSRGSSWTLVGSANIAKIQSLPLSADMKADVEAAVTAGNLAISPSTNNGTDADSLTWWRVDPRTGSTLGVGRYGRGAAAVEEGFLLRWAGASAWCAIGAGLQKAISGHVSYTSTVACVALGAFGARTGTSFTDATITGVFGMAMQIFQAVEDKKRGFS
jgi:hypothetical protein